MGYPTPASPDSDSIATDTPLSDNINLTHDWRISNPSTLISSHNDYNKTISAFDTIITVMIPVLNITALGIHIILAKINTSHWLSFPPVNPVAYYHYYWSHNYISKKRYIVAHVISNTCPLITRRTQSPKYHFYIYNYMLFHLDNLGSCNISINNLIAKHIYVYP